MKKEVIVQVIGKQRYPEGHEDSQELITEGMFYERNGTYYAVYKETELTGLEGTTTFISAKGEMVCLNRQGSVNVTQEFKKGVINRSFYSTSCGKLLLSVMPQRVEYDLTAQGGRISLEYDLFVDDILVSSNVLLLNIKEDLPQ